ncbi:MAG: hypothetical protein JEZ09_05405 [Salinivirgaceae bacterium]|nr:hypothetical protein [Salinivirgaceae bacterium]
MGLSIHYNGKFNSNAILSDLITEVKEIAETLKWDYKIFHEILPKVYKENKSHDNKIYGISIFPPECETVSICFLSNYRMSSSVHLKFYGNLTNPSEHNLLYMLSTKTQFAGVNIHKTIIEIFKHLKSRAYFEEFNLSDEGEYWETNDEKLLEQKFKENGTLLDIFSLAVETIPINQKETFEKYFERILKIIDDRNNRTKSPTA